MKKYYIMIDAGGSSIKTAILNNRNEIIQNTFSITTINSKGSREYILKTITDLLEGNILKAAECGELKGIAFSFPGPFDYQNGICLMKHKYQNIYGIKLREEIIARLEIAKNLPVIFEEDSIAFLKGEAKVGNARGFKRIIGITLGTGLGSAFMDNGKIIKDGPEIPAGAELWNIPDEEGILEDSISSRAIIKIYKRITGSSEKSSLKPDVSSIAQKARNGDIDSINTFSEFGCLMGTKLKNYADSFKAECMVIGGQIAKSFEFFSGSLKDELFSVSTMKKVTAAKYIDYSIFFGLLASF